MDIVFSFDDTGSMSSIRRIVRQNLKDLTKFLFGKISGLRIGVIIHNDYCDAPNHIYTLDLTGDQKKIEKFIEQDTPGGGGDAPECYELALHEATTFSWKSDKRALVLIGDQVPHKVGYTSGRLKCEYDWVAETEKLAKLNVKVYGIQALGNREATNFYTTISRLTNGVKLDLTQFQHIQTYLMAIASHQNGTLEEFESSDATFGTNIALKNMFRKLRGMVEDKGFAERVSILSRFQVMNVSEICPIREFVLNNGCTFQKGRGFYQLVERKPNGEANWEEIQEHKEVIFVDRETGETHSDTRWCREQLGIPFGTRGKVRPLQIPEIMDKYDVYIQSTSVNRKLDPGTKFLYELEEK